MLIVYYIYSIYIIYIILYITTCHAVTPFMNSIFFYIEFLQFMSVYVI